MTSDAVIVGARCAGASLAVHLARAGLTVAVLDAAKLPSNQAMSTHLIQPPGMDELDGLGIGARVRARTPGIQAGRFDFDDRTMTLRYGAGRTAHCLRRAELDAMLQAAAVAAGAALQPESRVVGLVRATDGRVTGVDVHRASGRTERLHARLVIGADGRNSTIARLVAAEEYLGYDAPRACYWAYWRRPAGWDAGLLYNGSQRDLSRVLFPTDDDLVLIASSPPVARAHAWRADHRAAYLADLRACAPLAALLGDDEPVGRVLGMVKTRYFFRAAVGPGWALVG
ncbi:MAG: FAD-dependent monooxygenase, partial [Candidatus Binatia bacterium]